MDAQAVVERAAVAAERRAVALRQLVTAGSVIGWEVIADMLSGVQESNGNGNVVQTGRAPQSDEPRGREAVRRIVSARPGRWSLPQLCEEMKEQGWFTSRKAVHVAVARMVNTGDARATSERGVYEFPAPDAAEEAMAA